MDDFNNFFDDQRNNDNPRMPIYHTPNHSQEPNPRKTNVALIISIIIAALMCVIVIVNVIVLATLKTSIAQEYAASISDDVKSQYYDAISDALSDSQIKEDIQNSVENSVVETLNKTIGEVGNENSASVARIYMYKTANANVNSSTVAGLASGFLISDTNKNGTLQRYLVTNAHVVRYEAEKTIGGMFPQISYSWATYPTMYAFFEENINSTTNGKPIKAFVESKFYKLEVVAYGSYTGKHLSAENDQADLAILRIVSGKQPSNIEHPSLKIYGGTTIYNNNTVELSFAERGSSVALIGNPEGIGNTNSVSVGVITQTNIAIKTWGDGTFIMTDAAVNGGNSGGPMINQSGYVVGVIESKLVDERIDNMGFAVSSGTLLVFIDKYASDGTLNALGYDVSINCIRVTK